MSDRPRVRIALARLVRHHARVVVALGMLTTSACGDRNEVRVQLQAYTPPGFDVRRVELRVQVAGPVAGLRYRWFSVAGANDPQESDLPASVFTFADGTTRDRVTVEVWRGERRVSRDELDVEIDETRARQAGQAAPEVDVMITLLPPYDVGGPETRADIAGRVSGAVLPTYDVVVYARANNVWYIQPEPAARQAIDSKGNWGTWTHTGSDYAALVVRPAFDPLPRYDVLPQVGGFVVARVTAEGQRR